MLCEECGALKILFDAGLLRGPDTICPVCELHQFTLRRDRLLAFPYQEIRRATYLPFLHQFDGVLDLINHSARLLADEMGVAKSKQVIDAAQVLFTRQRADRVIVVGPSVTRGVWAHAETGQIAVHSWPDLPIKVSEYHQKIRQFSRRPTERQLKWIVTNYEFIRSKVRIAELLKYCGPKTILVLDESSAVKNSSSQQTKACKILRSHCGYAWLLNGTPMAESPLDLFSQGNLLDTRILDCPSKTQFFARYAVMEAVRGPGGRPLSKNGRTVERAIAWPGVKELEQQFAPYVTRRMKIDCLDLPPKMPSVSIPVALTPKTWKVYKEFKDEAITYLSGTQLSMAPQITTKIMRLSQITSGFIGGVREWSEEIFDDDAPPVETHAEEIGREKLDVLIEWLKQRLEENPNFKVLIWSTHRFEILRTATEIKDIFHGAVGTIIGAQKPASREAAVRLLQTATAPRGPAAVVANPASGGKSLTLTAASTAVYMSNHWSLERRLQSEDRLHRLGQKRPVSYYDMMAEGPKGQRTMDAEVILALAMKDNLANRTMESWRTALGKLDSEG